MREPSIRQKLLPVVESTRNPRLLTFHFLVICIKLCHLLDDMHRVHLHLISRRSRLDWTIPDASPDKQKNKKRASEKTLY